MSRELINSKFIADVQQMLAETGFDLKQLPKHIKVILKRGMWKSRIVKQTGERKEYKRFEEFVVAEMPYGLGSDISQIKNLCKDDTTTVDLIEKEIKKPVGNPNFGSKEKPIFDNIQNSPAPTGTSQAAALRRLRKDRPDLHKKVLKKELSAHNAMLQAGFRERKIQIPIDPERAAETIKKHFTETQVVQLIAYLTQEVD
jgi:hypothetical protein